MYNKMIYDYIEKEHEELCILLEDVFSNFDKKIYQEIINELNKKNISVLKINLKENSDLFTISNCIKDLVTLYDLFSPKYKSISMIGFSFGATVGYLASEQLKLNKITLFSADNLYEYLNKEELNKLSNEFKSDAINYKFNTYFTNLPLYITYKENDSEYVKLIAKDLKKFNDNSTLIKIENNINLNLQIKKVITTIYN